MIANIEHRRGTLCQLFGHRWHATNQQGMYQCTTCKTFAYCPACLLLIPVGVPSMVCDQHREQKACQAAKKLESKGAS